MTIQGIAVAGSDNAAQELAAQHRKGIGWSGIIAPIIGFAMFIGLWYLMHYWALEALWDKPSFLITAPHRVVRDSFFESIPREQMLRGLGWTAAVSLVGLGISIVLGMSLAIVMAQATWIERSFWPYLIAAQAVPILAIVPQIGIIFGTGFSSRTLVCVIISIFPIVSNTLFGLLSAESSQHDLFSLHDASRLTRLRKLQFPAALPAIFTGFRISAGLSVIGAVVGELFFRQGGKGIGIVMDQYRQRSQYPLQYGALILSSLLGIVVFVIFGWLGQAIVGRWHESTRKST